MIHLAETTEQYRARINQLKTSIENEPLIKKMRDDIAEGVSKTGNRQADIEVRQDTLEDDFVAVQQDASSASPSGAEVAVARGGFTTLDERLTTKEQEVNAQLAQIAQDISQKASINYVDAILMDIFKGGPKGPFNSIALLKAAYPTGTEGTWLVFDTTFTDGAHSFMWDSTINNWRDLGVYQAVSLADGSVDFKKMTANLKKTIKDNYLDISTTYQDGYFLYNTSTNTARIEVTSNFKYSAPIFLAKGKTILLNVRGYNALVSVIVSCNNDGSNIVPLINSSNSNLDMYQYTAKNDMYVRVSAQTVDFNTLGIYDNKLDVITDKVYGNFYPKYTDGTDFYVRATDGVMVALNTYVTSDVFTLKYGQKVELTYSGANTENVVSLLSEWDESGKYIKNLKSLNTSSGFFSYTPEKDTEYLRFSHNDTFKLKVTINSLDLLTYKNNVLSLNTNSDFFKHLITNVTTVGDSLTAGGYYGEGYSGEAIKENYPFFLQKLTDWNVINVSKNGATPISWWTDFGLTTDFSTPDTVIIGFGTNGGLTDTIDTDVDVPNQSFSETNTGQYARIINAFRKGNPDCHIFLGKIFVTTGDLNITNSVIDKLAVLFNCSIVDDRELYGNPVMHYNNAVHYGKVGNLHKANIYYKQILGHIKNNLTDYEVLIDK